MRKKVSILFVMLLLVICIVTILPHKKIVEADTSPPVYEIDNEYIYSIAENLSDIIKDPAIYPEGKLAKGRAFGSDGERAAADELAERMSLLDLYDPTTETYPSKEYREQIQNIKLNLLVQMPFRYNTTLKKYVPERGYLRQFINITDIELKVKHSLNIFCQFFYRHQS